MLNDFYFSDIDTEAKAYFVGYLLADGCITKHNGEYRQIQLHLSIRDIDILNRLKEETESNRKIYISPDGNRCMFRDNSYIMAEDLARFGIVPNKTGLEDPDFSDIPTHLLRHTIRGLIDGDGWISISHTSTGRTVTSIGICGSEMTCRYVTEFLSFNVGVGVLKPSKVKNKNCYKLGYSSLLDNKAIIKYLYKDAEIFLNRKYEHALEILNM